MEITSVSKQEPTLYENQTRVITAMRKSPDKLYRDTLR